MELNTKNQEIHRNNTTDYHCNSRNLYWKLASNNMKIDIFKIIFHSIIYNYKTFQTTLEPTYRILVEESMVYPHIVEVFIYLKSLKLWGSYVEDIVRWKETKCKRESIEC